MFFPCVCCVVPLRQADNWFRGVLAAVCVCVCVCGVCVCVYVVCVVWCVCVVLCVWCGVCVWCVCVCGVCGVCMGVCVWSRDLKKFLFSKRNMKDEKYSKGNRILPRGFFSE
jgi:hypothetical protein